MKNIDFNKLMMKAEYNTLTSNYCYDNCNGNSSMIENKSSLWAVCGNRVLRLCNIATSNCDNVDDFPLVVTHVEFNKEAFYSVLPDMLSEVEPKKTKLYMNTIVLQQLSVSELFTVVEDKYHYMAAECIIDNSIKNNEKTVL